MKYRDGIELTILLRRAQERSLRRLAWYGDSRLDEAERLTGQAEELEYRIAKALCSRINEEVG